MGRIAPNPNCRIPIHFTIFIIGAVAANATAQIDETNPLALFSAGRNQTEALQAHERIYQATGFGNTFLVTTAGGNVVIDTSIAFMAPRHKQLLMAVSDAPVRYIVLTHGHGDHTGGVGIWKQDGTEVVAQENFVEFQHYQARLRGFFALRNAAQFPRLAQASPDRYRPRNASPGNYAAEIEATILFDEEYTFQLGDLTFELFHTPGETYDHLTVWIPELKAAFTGDNYYGSFPNIYTLRGTKPRWALDYVESLNEVLALEPEILLPSHGTPVRGTEEIARRLTQYRDAILYVHDATVRGMNEGKDVYTLMQEIALPEELDIGEGYGTIAWSVRGIYEGYAGWFGGEPADMYNTPPSAVYPDLVELAGGPAAVAERAEVLRQRGDLEQALRLANVALEADENHLMSLQTKLAVLTALRAGASNANEAGWLEYGIRQTQERIDRIEERAGASR